MALMDKMKQQASQLAQKAQEAGKAGQSKLEDVQAKRKTDGLYRDLGAAVYAQRVGRGDADSDAKINALVDELSALEADQASGDTSSPKTDDAKDDGTPEGGFTL